MTMFSFECPSKAANVVGSTSPDSAARVAHVCRVYAARGINDRLFWSRGNEETDSVGCFIREDELVLCFHWESDPEKEIKQRVWLDRTACNLPRGMHWATFQRLRER